jgi:anhydro-N-acetylmuramic acid kinase
MKVIGLMSGTSLDGVDAAVLETDGETVQGFGPRITLAYPPDLRARLREVIGRLAGLDAAAHPGLPEAKKAESVVLAEEELTAWHVAAVRKLGVAADLIGMHGQTVLHAPEKRLTRQIGDARFLAAATQTPVACDFRLADVAAGGQGAPFAPLFHAALAAGLEKPLLVVNIGGVANLTWIGEAPGEILACDTGPGNALLDDFMLSRTGTAMDLDGRMAQRGMPDRALLEAWLKNPFFALPAPKSLDRQHFADALEALAHHATEDGAATLAAFTAEAIARTTLPAPPRRVLVTGGGRRNPAIMAALAGAIGVSVEPVEAAGWDGDALEAQCFGFLAVRVLRGLPLSLPGTTGVPAPMPGGRIEQP